METTLYHYRGIIKSVYDGDTCTADIDLGLHVWMRGEKLRLYRINTPEVRGPERMQGLRSREFLKDLIQGKEVLIQTIKDRNEKYGRYLAGSTGWKLVKCKRCDDRSGICDLQKL